eukprot:TRINITY_DN3283_c0_g1_i3.p2 TRINITY_DN3283_c0_g1~~TRINITY_DN3283_c0_g1_i3.p2  ORF type:complete len:132 (-),score=17.04 TRINITY_DN3283_c0_g1_i3:147-542(-)
MACVRFTLPLSLLSPPWSRISSYRQFRDSTAQILVTTSLFAQGVNIPRVNIVFNYDIPEDPDTYFNRVCLASVGLKGLAISFVSTQADADMLADIQRQFDIFVAPLPTEIDTATYCVQPSISQLLTTTHCQ